MICSLCGKNTPEQPKEYPQGRTVLYLCSMCYAQKQLLNQTVVAPPKMSFWSAWWLKIKDWFKL